MNADHTPPTDADVRAAIERLVDAETGVDHDDWGSSADHPHEPRAPWPRDPNTPGGPTRSELVRLGHTLMGRTGGAS